MASDSNSERYRKRLMSCKTAAIPFLGKRNPPPFFPCPCFTRPCHLRDLTALLGLGRVGLTGLHLSDLTFVSEAGKATTDRQEREAQVCIARRPPS